MKKKFTEAQIVFALSQAEAGRFLDKSYSLNMLFYYRRLERG